MVTTLQEADVRRLRLRAQWLNAAGPPSTGASWAGPSDALDPQLNGDPAAQRVAQVARHMLALQGQDWRSSRWALGVRAPGVTLGDVDAAYNTGLIVRSWPMRGTIHVVAAEDIGWLQRVTNERVLAGAAKRREGLGMSDAMLERLVEVTELALQGGKTLSRDELSERWSGAGLEWHTSWRYHLIWWMCQNGLTVLGPVTDGEPRLALATDWIGHAKNLSCDDALVELAARYTTARGPVQVRDLAWWAGLTMRDTKRAVALAADAGLLQLVRVEEASGSEVHGAPDSLGDRPTAGDYWCAPELLDLAVTPAPDATGADDWLVLPSFDEMLLGYKDRSAQLHPDHFERIVPGRNGMFLATIMHGGDTVATWKRAGTPKKPTIEITELPGRHVDLDALRPEFQRWDMFQRGAESREHPEMVLTVKTSAPSH